MTNQNELARELTALIQTRREASPSYPFIVAVDGRCASGKTTVATAVAQALDCPLLHMDDFFLRPEQRTPRRLSTPGENIDHERFLSELLLPLRTGKQGILRPFDCATRTLGQPTPVPPAPLILIEGSYALHPALREHYDLRILLTVSPALQMERLRRREGEAGARVFRDRWIPLEERYFASCDVEAAADAVLFSE